MKRGVLIAVCMCCLMGITSSFAQGGIERITDGNQSISLVVTDDAVWSATSGGVVKWDRTDGTYRKYLRDETLLSSQINDVVMDSDGVLWFATEKGLTCNDNGTWTTLTVADGLPDEQVNDLFLDGDDNIWCATDGGICMYNGESFTLYTGADIDLITSVDVASVAVDGNGTIWGASRGGINRYADGVWADFDTWNSELENATISCTSVANNGTVWFGADGWLITYVNSEWRQFGESAGILDDNITDIAFTDDNMMWIAYENSGAAFLNSSGQWTYYTTAEGLADNDVRDIFYVDNNNIWFSTGSGVSYKNGDTWETYACEQTLAGNYITAIAVDGDAVWYATFDGGISRYDDSGWTVYNTMDGLPTNYINDIAVFSDGRLVAAFNQNGIGIFDNDEWTYYTTADGLHNNGIRSLLITSDDVLWCGGFFGITKIEDDVFTVYNDDNGLEFTIVYDMVMDGNGILWAACLGGVGRFDGETWQSYDRDNGLRDYTVSSIGVTPSGDVWAGAVNAAYYFNGEGWTDTLYDDDNFGTVQDIYTDEDGCLWFSSFNGGAYCFDGEHWSTISEEDGLNSNRATAIARDANGDLHIGTSEGVGIVRGPVAVNESDSVPKNFSLTGAYPNPFNMSTTLHYTVNTAGHVSLMVYSVTGQVVRELVDDDMSPGAHTVTWDGTDMYGRPVASGVYIGSLASGASQSSTRMMLLK